MQKLFYEMVSNVSVLNPNKDENVPEGAQHLPICGTQLMYS
jgi:hypothetical protein